MNSLWHSASGFRSVLMAMLACVIFLAGCGPTDEQKVRECLSRFQSAMDAKDGALAASLVDQNTLEWYSTIRDLALGADADRTRSLPYSQRVMVVTVRHNLKPSYVKTLNGAQLCALALQNDWMDGAYLEEYQLSSILVQGDQATAEGKRDHDRTGRPFTFRREDSHWKFDLLSFVSIEMDARDEQLRRQPAVSEQMNDHLLLELQVQSGRKVSPTIWDKPAIE